MVNRSLSVADVIALHAAMMEAMGDHPSSLRDEGLLESAVLRPQMAAHYEGADLIRQAVLIAVGTSHNQPFTDGNKRTGYIAAVTLLRVNGRPFAGEPLDLAREIEKVAQRSDSLDVAIGRFDLWLRNHVP